MMLCLEKADEKMASRLELLETSVFKKPGTQGKTKFDELADRFLEVQTNARVFKEDIQDQVSNFKTKVENFVFEISNQLVTMSNYKKILDTNT